MGVGRNTLETPEKTCVGSRDLLGFGYVGTCLLISIRKHMSIETNDVWVREPVGFGHVRTSLLI